ncbi:hypothetical protein GGF46_003589 [Coemansia sp. RSA 552]|nr:hypothetical protein GGF46_003589 [Coemansia sp. RSA 552]
MRRGSINMPVGFRRSQQVPGAPPAHNTMRSMDLQSQRNRPSTARSRLSQGLAGGSSFKEPRHSNVHGDGSTNNSPYMQSAGLGGGNDSRISLLSMTGGARDDAPGLGPADASRQVLGPSVKNIKSSRALSNQHTPRASEAGRPRSRTQSSEQGIVTVFSGAQEPPPLDPDLDALNRLPQFRPLVVAPSSNRLSGLFQTGTRYIEPTAEQLNLDETELTGLCFSFRDYLTNRVQHICDRQAEFVAAAKHIGTRTVETQTRLLHADQIAKHDQGGLSVLKSLQRQTEKSYELIQDILHDLERLEAALPAHARVSANESRVETEFPYLSHMLTQRRRSTLPAGGSEHSNSSVPASPITSDDARVSFDGEAIHPMEMASIAMLASQGTPRSIKRRSVQPFGPPRPPNSTRSIYGDYKGSHSRSEVSLSKEQVVWSPQISATESAHGYFPRGDSPGHMSLADVEEEYERCVRSVGADSTDEGDGSRRSGEFCPGAIAVPSDPTVGVATVSAEDHHTRFSPPQSPPRSTRRGSARSSTDTAQQRPAVSSGSARVPHLRVPQERGAGASASSPRSMPRTMSLQSGSSFGSSPSTPSALHHTPIGSPSAHAIMNQLNVAATGTGHTDLHPQTRAPQSPQFPLEATRMLKQVILEQSDSSGGAARRPASRSSIMQSGFFGEHHRETPPLSTGTEGSDTYDSMGVGNERKSRTSSMAASQLSATEGSDGAELIQTISTPKPATDGRGGHDSTRGSNPSLRTNPERMSTWSSSSARTLADGVYSSRVSSVDDQLRHSKRPPSSAALNTLTASAAVINRQTRGSSGGDNGRKTPTAHGTGPRVAGPRVAVDLGLSIRSDLERRVRSYSESGRDPQLLNEGRPHSSMGFHETVAGAPIWSARPDAIHARRHSPHSASLRHFRAEKFNPNRRSMMSTGGQLSRCMPSSPDLDDEQQAPQSDAASISTSCSASQPATTTVKAGGGKQAQITDD